MRNSFVHLFWPTSKGISATTSIARLFDVFTSISILHQLITPNGRGKKLPGPSSPGSDIRIILLMLHPMISSCLAT
jgi:hypothetical protein